MGRQIPIVTAWPDELAIIRQIAAGDEVRIFRDLAETRDSLWIDDWETNKISEGHYSIWPTHFLWKPIYFQLAQPCISGVEGKWRIRNSGDAPIITLSRHLHGPDSAGRLYWSKYFTALGPLGYDVAAFDKLVDGIWRWVRKNGTRDPGDGHRPFVLPHTMRQRTGAS